MSRLSRSTGDVPPGTGDGQDSEKRRQILDGARSLFQVKGYEGASMDAIAKAAGVSKGTLYVYFSNKDELFETLILEEKCALADAICAFMPTGDSFRERLKSLGIAYCEMLSRESHVSSLRMVIGAIDKFPAIGALFFKTGPERGTTMMGEYFEKAIADGLMKPCDPRIASHHFISLCTSDVLKRALFAVDIHPSRETIERAVEAGLDVFMAAYAAEGVNEPAPRHPGALA